MYFYRLISLEDLTINRGTFLNCFYMHSFGPLVYICTNYVRCSFRVHHFLPQHLRHFDAIFFQEHWFYFQANINLTILCLIALAMKLMTTSISQLAKKLRSANVTKPTKVPSSRLTNYLFHYSTKSKVLKYTICY